MMIDGATPSGWFLALLVLLVVGWGRLPEALRRITRRGRDGGE